MVKVYNNCLLKDSKRFLVGKGIVVKTIKFANNNNKNLKAGIKSFAKNSTRNIRWSSKINFFLVAIIIEELDLEDFDYQDLPIFFPVNRRVIKKTR